MLGESFKHTTELYRLKMISCAVWVITDHRDSLQSYEPAVRFASADRSIKNNNQRNLYAERRSCKTLITVLHTLTTRPVFPDRSSAQLRQGFRPDIVELTDKKLWNAAKNYSKHLAKYAGIFVRQVGILEQQPCDTNRFSVSFGRFVFKVIFSFIMFCVCFVLF
jgi:hypothetical protein